MKRISRRELFAGMLATPLAPAVLHAQKRLTAPVAVARCSSYEEDQVALLSRMFDRIGGIGRLVQNKTVTIKLNLTGSPGLRFRGLPLGVTHYTHPNQIGALAQVLHKAGARRIRFVESPWATAGPMEEYMLDSGWNVRRLTSAAPNIEWVNTNFIGNNYKSYSLFKVPGGGTIFPSYHLSRAYEETDVMVSLAKLKDHATCGVTLAMKNMFGITPASIYGDDAGEAEPNERPTKGRVSTCHLGKRQPASIAAAEKNSASSREPGYRMPRITAELNAARPIHISIIDGIETMAGGEGPWVRGSLRHVKPGVMIVGTNPVTTDTVATAVMGYNPRDERKGAFAKCDNTLLLAEQLGIGTADLNQIEVRGEKIADVIFPFAPPAPA